jgi:hypothetical protein
MIARTRSRRAPRPLAALALLLVALAPAAARAGDAPAKLAAPAPPDPAAIAAREAHLAEKNEAMTVLAGWAAMSMASGALLWATAGKDDYTRAVGIQSLAWGAVNGVIAGVNIGSDYRKRNLDKPATYWQSETKGARRIYLINVGLDALYVATGALLMGLGKTDFVRGTGAGIAAQGGFLLAFDATFGIGTR